MLFINFWFIYNIYANFIMCDLELLLNNLLFYHEIYVKHIFQILRFGLRVVGGLRVVQIWRRTMFEQFLKSNDGVERG